MCLTMLIVSFLILIYLIGIEKVMIALFFKNVYACLCTACMQCLQKPEESIRSPGTVVTVVICHVGVGN